MLYLILNLNLFADADADADAASGPAPVPHPRPSGSRTARPCSVHFPEGLGYRNWEEPALRKTTSAAYAVIRYSIAEGVRLPRVSPWIARHAPFWHLGRSLGCTAAPAVRTPFQSRTPSWSRLSNT